MKLRGELTNLERREKEVIRLVATGKTNKEIAQAMGTSENSVKQRVTRIMDKINLPSRTRAGLAVWYMRTPLG